ncbi:MAG: ABC transporter permease [Planctomycetota bacterium]|nr:MAG: ABC transporter permease [Planctomycetota bacterium]
MNWQQFQTFLWLRWRLRINQLRRAGTANFVILAVLAGAALVVAVFLFAGCLLVGLFALPQALPGVLLLVWDGLVLAFLFCWCIGLITDLQRSEVLSLDKFMHLPVSPAGGFLINYVSSFFSLTLLVFLPAMLGLALGMILGKGAALLLTLPLLAAFVLMVTALTYQFQGWLASLMINPRRSRTVIVIVTMTFVLICQLPNLVNIFRPWENQEREQIAKRWSGEQAELERSVSAGKITLDQFRQKQEEHQQQIDQMNQRTWLHVQEAARLINLALPPGWLALGAADAADGQVVPALLGTLGLGLIGAGSLWRSYRTTVRLYTGQFTSGSERSAAPVPAPRTEAVASSPALLEKKLPWLSEYAAAITLGSFRSLTRAPEAKLLLLAPILMVVIFGGLLFRHSGDLPEAARPLLLFGVMATILLSMFQLMGNQFGFDRNGFRVFVLCAAPRRDILLGKNLATAPLVLGLAMLVVAILQIISPLRLEHFLALLPLSVSMYLLFCLAANALSILAPLPVAAGSLKPRNVKGIPLLLHVAFVFVLPMVMAPAMLPLGIEFLAERLGWIAGMPLCLLLSLVECGVVIYLYHLILDWEGLWLQAREQRILDIVTQKGE